MSDAAIGARIRSLLDDRARSGSRDVALLVHSEDIGSGVIEALARAARSDPGLRGLPPRVAPLAVSRIDVVGIDLWLAAFAWGAAQVWTLVTHEDATPQREAIALRLRVAEAIMTSLGFAGEHLRIIGGGEVSRVALDLVAQGGSASVGEPAAALHAALQRLDHALQRPAAATVDCTATFVGADGERSLLDIALDHLLAQAAKTQ